MTSYLSWGSQWPWGNFHTGSSTSTDWTASRIRHTLRTWSCQLRSWSASWHGWIFHDIPRPGHRYIWYWWIFLGQWGLQFNWSEAEGDITFDSVDMGVSVGVMTAIQLHFRQVLKLAIDVWSWHCYSTGYSISWKRWFSWFLSSFLRQGKPL